MNLRRAYRYLYAVALVSFIFVGGAVNSVSAQTTQITSTQSDEVEGTSEIDQLMQEAMERKERERLARGDAGDDKAALELEEGQVINLDATIFVLHEPLYPRKIHFSRRTPLIASLEFGPSGNHFSYYTGVAEETGTGLAKSWTTYSAAVRFSTWLSARSGVEIGYRTLMSTGVSNYNQDDWSTIRQHITSQVIEANYLIHFNNIATRSLRLHTFTFTGVVGMQLGFNGFLSDYSSTRTFGINSGLKMAYSPKSFPAAFYIEPRVGSRFYMSTQTKAEKPAYSIESSLKVGVAIYLFGAPFEIRESMDTVRSSIAETHTGRGSSLLSFSLASGVEGIVNAQSADYASTLSFYSRVMVTSQFKKTRSYLEVGVNYYDMPYAGKVQTDQLWYDNYLKDMPVYGLDVRYRFAAKPKDEYSSNAFNRRSEIALSLGAEGRFGAGAMMYGGLAAARASFELADDLGISLFIEPKVSAFLCSNMHSVMGSNPIALATSVSFGLDFKLGNYSKAAKRKSAIAVGLNE